MQVHQNYSLKKFHTFGMDVYAKSFANFHSSEELQILLKQEVNTNDKMILGGGSNILFTKDFNGLVLKNEIPGIAIVHEDNDEVLIKAGAGINWHSFVIDCVKNNYGGVENLSLIPGNVGATPMQNIGAYGVEIKDVFHELEAFDLIENFVRKFNASECEFGYRESVFKRIFKGRFVILNVTYRLQKNPVFNISYGAIEDELKKMGVEEMSVKAVSDAVISIRTSKLPDPKILGNAGSFFKNPVIDFTAFGQLNELISVKGITMPYYKIDDNHYKIPAGWLIEQCGWKGYRKGDAGCYQKQALVLVNYANATGKEIYNLSKEIKISVQEKFGIDIEREVNIM
ncbi:MAG: UDP-N-acetylmuramate dehydrogenase [Ginsengibacter sp.]